MSKKELIFDEFFNFEEGRIEHFDELLKWFGNVESIEDSFDIDFSCGDGKFIPDIEDYTEEMEKYDGNVCLKSLPRFRKNKKLIKGWYRFRVWRPEDYISEKDYSSKITKSN